MPATCSRGAGRRGSAAVAAGVRCRQSSRAGVEVIESGCRGGQRPASGTAMPRGGADGVGQSTSLALAAVPVGGRRTEHQVPQPFQGSLLLPEHVAAADCHLGANLGEGHAEPVAHEEQPPVAAGKLRALDLDVEEEVAPPLALDLVTGQVNGVRSIGGARAPSPPPVDDAHVLDRPVQPCLLVGDGGPAATGGGERPLDEILAIPGRDALPKEESPHGREQASEDLGQGGSGVVGVFGEHKGSSRGNFGD